MEQQEKMHTTAEVAQRLRVTRRTVYDWIHEGHLTAVKVGPKLWLVTDADLKQFTSNRSNSRPMQEKAPELPKPAPVQEKVPEPSRSTLSPAIARLIQASRGTSSLPDDLQKTIEQNSRQVIAEMRGTLKPMPQTTNKKRRR